MKILLFLLVLSLIYILLPFFLTPESLTRRNGDFSDLVFPNYFFVKNSFLKYGEIPLWNPTLFSGIPETVNPQSPIIYFPNLLTLLLPIDIGIVLLVLFHFFIAGVYLIRLGKEIFVGDLTASAVLLFSFTLSPFLWGKVAVGHISQLFATLLFAPVLFYGNHILQGKKGKNILLLGFFSAMQYVNHPTIWFYTIFFGGIFWVYWSFVKDVRKVMALIVGITFALLLLSPVILLHIQGSVFITRLSLDISDLSIPVWSIKRFVYSVLVPSNFLSNLETEVWLYPSIIGIILAVIGFLKLKIKIQVIAGVILAIGLLIALGTRTPFYSFLVTNFPFFSYLRVTTRDWFVVITVISLLAGNFIYQFKGPWKKLLCACIFLDLLVFSSLRVWYVPDIMNLKASKINDLLMEDKNFRYYCTSRCLPGRDTIVKKIITADGYHPIILKNYREAISQAGGFPPPKYTGNIPTTFDENAQPDAEKLGKFTVKWVISKKPLKDQSFVLRKQTCGYLLYKNMKVKPRARFQNDGNAEIVFDSPNTVVIHAQGDAGTLILADTFYPGWEVFVDGIKGEVFEVDGWARGVNLPSGRHTVEYKFKPLHHLFEQI